MLTGLNPPAQTHETKPLTDWFKEAVNVNPNGPALTYSGQTLSYRELDQEANRLAHRLQKHGAGKGSVVALYTKRSLELVIGILGVLKAERLICRLTRSCQRTESRICWLTVRQPVC
ncbi:AMP-binding protein [Bacillus stercoris]|nr:AMP-binding protein [Bacillus stercoris]